MDAIALHQPHPRESIAKRVNQTIGGALGDRFRLQTVAKTLDNFADPLEINEQPSGI